MEEEIAALLSKRVQMSFSSNAWCVKINYEALNHK